MSIDDKNFFNDFGLYVMVIIIIAILFISILSAGFGEGCAAIRKSKTIDQNSFEYLRFNHSGVTGYECKKTKCSAYVDDLENKGYKKQILFICSDKKPVLNESPCGLIKE